MHDNCNNLISDNNSILEETYSEVTATQEDPRDEMKFSGPQCDSTLSKTMQEREFAMNNKDSFAKDLESDNP